MSSQKIEKDLRASHGILSSYFAAKNKNYSEATQSLILTQPNLRAVLATVKAGQGDSLFDDEDDDSSQPFDFEEAAALLSSTLEHLPVFQRSEVFAVLDSTGNVIFSKNRDQAPPSSLGAHPLIKSSLAGAENSSFWHKDDDATVTNRLLPAADTGEGIYQIFVKPVKFQNQVKGLVVVGFALSQPVIAELTNIAHAQLAFHLEGQRIQSGPEAGVRGQFYQEGVTDSTFQFSADSEIYIAYPFALNNSMSKNMGQAILYRSMTKELEFFTDLKQLFLWIGLVSGLIALLCAFVLSGSVTKAIASLMAGVKEVGDGNLGHRVHVQGKDEFKKLADAFNTMTLGLQEKERIKKTFKRYVNPRVVETLLTEGEHLNLGGESRNLVIFFSDIAGFTKISEKLTPETTVQFLNQYLGEMTSIIEGAEGIVDKYIGDAIVAYWVLTSRNKDGYRKACKAAILQLQAVETLKTRWQDEGLTDLAGFSIRAGIHSGQALMGNIGSESRMDYTIIGDDVNTAARMESINKLYGSQVMVSEAVKENLDSDFLTRELDSVYLVGKNAPSSIFELLTEPPAAGFFASFSEALTAYRTGHFAQAQSLFENHGQTFNVKAADVFIARCKELSAKPPTDWKGIYRLQRK